MRVTISFCPVGKQVCDMECRLGYKRTLDVLCKEGRLEIPDGVLTVGRQQLVNEVLALKRAYQDQPANVPYMFRPICFVLEAGVRRKKNNV